VQQPTIDAAEDATRRTHLANERTYLAWWRTGLTALAVALGVGRILPELGGGHTWPYVVLGSGYAILGIAMIAYGSRRQRAVDEAVAAGSYAQVERLFMRTVTGFGIALGVATLALVLAQP
jgi:putative membrane protein